MIVLDTNVLSELMKREPDERVAGWLAGQPASRLFTTAITEAEILHGVARLPDGRRQRVLEEAVRALFEEDLEGRVLPFGRDAALPYARIAVERQRLGRPVAQLDAQIAAIARCRGAAVATRNVSDFEHCGIEVIDPWQA